MNIVSIIVCTYNQEDTIGRCLDAILSQDSPWPFEIIIGEDCSIDNTRYVCENYVKRYPDIVRLMSKAPNKGILQNYFDCVRAAKGKFIMECGGDDVWMPGRIKTCLEIMEAHEDVGMIITPYITKDESTGIQHPLNPTPWHEGVYSGEELTYQFAGFIQCSPGSSAMTRLSMLKEAMEQWPQFFSGREFLMEDMQITATMGIMGKMYYHEKPTYYYYVGDKNTSTGADEMKTLRFDKNALKMLVCLTNAIPLDKECVLPAMKHRLNAVLMHCFRLNDKEQRDAILKQAKEWGIPVTGKTKYTILLTSNPVTWSIMLFARRLFIGIKNLF